MSQSNKSLSLKPHIYDTQRVPAVPNGEKEPRGARQRLPQRDGTRPTLFESSAAAIKSFSSQLAALDLSSLGGPGEGAADTPDSAATAAGAAEPGILQLLAQITGTAEPH